MYDVTCVGIITADVLVRPVEKLPEKGLLGAVDRIELQAGGCAANAAIALARLGIKTGLIAKTGTDSFSRFVLSEISGNKVDVSGIFQDQHVQTSASVVPISRDGERTVLHCFGANAEFTYNDINYELIKASKILFIAGTFLLPAFDGAGATCLLKKASRDKILCCLDTAWDPSGKWMDTLGDCLPYLDWFMPSYDEAVMLSGEKSPEMIAQTFINRGVKNVIIKMGADGCYVKPNEGSGMMVPAFTGIPVVDTSGAGDSFCAGFLAGLTRGRSVLESINFGHAVGAHCVMKMGTTTGIPSFEKIEEFIRGQKV